MGSRISGQALNISQAANMVAARHTVLPIAGWRKTHLGQIVVRKLAVVLTHLPESLIKVAAVREWE